MVFSNVAAEPREACLVPLDMLVSQLQGGLSGAARWDAVLSLDPLDPVGHMSKEQVEVASHGLVLRTVL